MVLTTYDPNIHGPLLPNLAFDSKFDSQLGDIFQVAKQGKELVFVQFEPFSWESLKKDAIVFETNARTIWIRYFAADAHVSLIVDALNVAVLDYLDVFYLDGVGIEFVDADMSPKKFAEILHGFHTDERFEPFLKLQWQPIRTQDGIRFIFQPKR